MESIVRIVDDNTRLVTVLVNHDERMLAFPGVEWATAESRETHVEERTGTAEEEIILYCFDWAMSTQKVIAGLAMKTAFWADGLEPSSPEELRDLLKITQTDPNLPTPIVALGVSWRSPDRIRGGGVPCLEGDVVRTGRHFLPSIEGDAGDRSLDLGPCFEDDWNGGWWFAARRRKPKR